MAAMLLQDRTVDLILLDLPYRPLDGSGISAANLADRFDRLAALSRRAGVQLLVLEPPSLPSALAGVLTQVSALRLELSRRSWIRLGRDVVGQRTEVRVARDRFGPAGRAAELRILYAEGGLRDACLTREELLGPGAGLAPPGGTRPAALAAVRPSPPLHSTRSPVPVDATPPSLLAPPSAPPGPQPGLYALSGGAGRSGRQAVE